MEELKNLLEELMDDYGDYLKNTAYYITGDLQIAEDLTQETFFSFYKSYYQYRHKSSYKTYLYRILMNHIKMHYRKRPSYRESLSYDAIDPSCYISFEDETVSHIDVLSAIEHLKDKERKIIILYYFNDLSIDNIAKITSSSKSGVKMCLKRSREKMKVKLEKEGYHETVAYYR